MNSPAAKYVALILLLAALAAQAVPFIFTKSGVCDEHGAHIPSGYVYLSTGTFSGGINNPPLMQVVVAAPLVLGQIDYSPFSDEGIWAARLPVLGLSLLLGLAVFCWAGSLYGGAAAPAALFLFSFEPNIIAHSGLATLDMGVTVFLFFAFFLLWKASREKHARWWMAACVAMTLALLCKFTAVLVLPLFVVLLFAATRGRGPLLRRIRGTAAALFFLCACFVVLSHVFYHLPAAGRDGAAVRARGEGAAESEALSAAGRGGPGEDGRALGISKVLESAARLALPDLYVDGSLGKLRHSEGGHFAYLAGARSLGGWWYYFPAAIGLKTPIPFLCLFLVSLLLWAVRPGMARGASFLFVPMIVYVAAMAWTGVNIGVRHVLFFYPCAAVAGGAVLGKGVHKKKIVLAALAALAIWHAAGSIRVFPHYLAYFNEIAGGPEGGPQYLIDSNIDWGQDDGLLKEFVWEEPDTVLVNPGAFSPSVGTIAVNVNSLMGIFRGDDTAYRWLRVFEPEGRIGYTWRIYRLGVGDYERAAAGSPGGPEAKVWLAAALKKAGRTEEALNLAAEVAGAHPERAGNVLFTSGWWLLEAGRYGEAEAAFKRSVEAGAGDAAYRALLAARAELRRENGSAGPDDYKELGDFYARNERTALAFGLLREGASVFPDDARLRVSLALLHGREGDFAAASEHAAAALRIAPSLTRAQRASDWADSMLRVERMTDDGAARLELGRYEHGFGRPLAAARHFWEAFGLDPSSEAALAAMGEIIVQAKLGVIELEAPAGPEGR
jgi:tetratricopeptide (TPR) repeat protein